MLVHCWQEGTMVQSVWKTLRQFLKKLNIELPYDPKIPLLGIYSKELKARNSNKYLYTRVHSTIITVAKRWKQPKFP